MTEKRVIKSVRDAYFNVPFYRQKYNAAGIDINRIRRLEDMKLLPVLTKEEVRNNYPDNIVRRGTRIEKCFHSSTSGSSGQPLSFIISPSGYAYYLAESARIYSMIGYRPWQRSCYLRSAPLALPGISASRQTHVSSTLPVAEQIAWLKKIKPHLIDSNPSILMNIAGHINSDDLKYIKPRCITVNSEMSTIEERDYISGVFKCPVYDEYGTHETWSIAAQCRQHRYHTSSDSVWVEYLDAQGRDVQPGESGDIVITATRSKAMPFIRYAIGDRGRPEGGTCSCGYHSPLMGSIDGRADDWLLLPSGKTIEPSRILGSCWRAARENPLLFDRFQITQKKRDMVVFKYVRGKSFDPGCVDKIVKDLQGIFGEQITVLPEEGEPESGDKRQALKSLVDRGDKP